MITRTERTLRQALLWMRAIAALIHEQHRKEEIKGPGVPMLLQAVESVDKAAQDALKEL